MFWNLSSTLSALKWAALVCLLACPSFVQPSYAQGPDRLRGDWQGPIPEGQSLFYRLDYGGSGTAYWAVHSQEEEPVQYSVNGSEITIHFPSKTTYVAELNGNQMNGKLSKRDRTVWLTLTKAATGANGGSSDAAGIQGDWQGLLPGNLPIICRLDNAGTGSVELAIEIDSEPVHYSLTGSQITITGAKGAYTATVNGNEMSGTFSRTGGGSRTVKLTKAAIPKSTGPVATTAKTHDTIQEAAANGDLAEVGELIKDNPDLVFSKDKKGETPLHTAAYTGHKDVAEFLLANRAEVNAKDDSGMTPLRLAALYGYDDVVQLLRQHGGHE